MNVIVQPSNIENKKFTAIIYDQDNRKIKTVHFGDNRHRYEDFTQHNDPERRKQYINRHRTREEQFWKHNHSNLLKPSYWSRYLTWESPSLQQAAKFIELMNKGVKIKLQV